MKDIYIRTTKNGKPLPGIYRGHGGLQAARKARTHIGGTKMMTIYLRKNGQGHIKEYRMGRKLLKKDERGPHGQKYKSFGKYVATHYKEQ